MTLNNSISSIKRLIHADQLLQNTSWMVVSEAVAKVSRVVTVIMLAGFLSPTEYGIAALALVCHELMRVFSRAGAGAKVIQCGDDELTSMAKNASLLQWVLCIALVTFQISTATALGNFYQQPDIAPLLIILASTYVFYPMVAVKVFMLQRENRMKYFGLASAICISIDNLSVVFLLLLGLGIEAVAYAKLIAAIAWAVAFGLAPVKNTFPGFEWAIFKPLSIFSIKVFGTELLKILRSQTDILLAAKLLTPELLGIYSFAKNAGVGLGQSLINAFLGGLLPFLSQEFRANRKSGCAD